MYAAAREECVATRPNDSVHEPDEPLFLDPSEAEIEEWAARERQRREGWLSGPTAEQKAAWARRERERRLSEIEGAPHARAASVDPGRLAQRYVREAQLAAEGAMSLLFKLSLSDALEQLVRAGREWEEEFTSQPTRRRRVPLDADPPELEGGHRSTRAPNEPEVPPRSD
jgi:hypothetical protein